MFTEYDYTDLGNNKIEIMPIFKDLIGKKKC